MIKFKGATEVNGVRVPVLGLGLSRGNWDRLLEGKPIRIEAGEFIPGLELVVVLLGGETEQAIADEMIRVAAVGPETRIHKDAAAKGEKS